MTKIIPPYIDKNCKSSGERMIFEILKNSSFTDDWIVLHSLNLSEHSKRLYGEIDFLLLIPNGGIYVMEVKGGGVKCVDGVWHFTNRFGKTYKSTIGPFNQARDAMFSLRSSIEKSFGRGHKYARFLHGFFVAFPHINFDRRSIEYEHWQVLDKDIIHSGTESFFSNLFGQFINKYKGQSWFSHDSLPTQKEISVLADFLRGDFERVRTIADYLDEFERLVKAYTEEQFRILDSIHINQRSVIQGGAGTGKTMIAVESAIRHASEGKSVFLTCYNRLIGEWMHKHVSDWKGKVTASHLHGFLFEASKGFDYDISHRNRQDFYTKYLPELIKDIYNKGIFKKFDLIIIDEGQDLIRNEYLQLFNEMLDGTLSNGYWEIYGDFERQAIYSQLSKPDMFKLLNNFAKYSNFLLKINCRNTKQIGEETALISDFEKPPLLHEYLEAIPVEYSFYKDSSHQAKILNELLNQLIEEGLPQNEMTLLSPKKIENSCCSIISEHKIAEIKRIGDFPTNLGDLGFATIQSFKGMENNYIIITDIDDIGSEQAQALLYVGMTRAKYGLIILISETQRDIYKQILNKKLK